MSFFIFILCFFGILSADPYIEKEFGTTYHIENDTLINYDGKKYPKINFKDALHEDLSFILKDPEQANIIHQAYANHIQPNLPFDLIKPFSTALLNVCVLFGSTAFSPEEALLSSLREQNVNGVDLKHFLAEANLPARSNLMQKSEHYTVVIITTSASGGNHSVACSIEKFLSSTPNIRCIVIDTETIAANSDVLMLATGLTTYDGFYAKYFQQNNQTNDLLLARDELCKELGKYIPSNFGLLLKEYVRRLNPDLILSTRNYCIDDMPLCTLEVPFRLIHCDYDLSHLLFNVYGKVPPKIMRFWLPSLDPRTFRPLFEYKKCLDLYNEQDDYQTVINKIGLITHQSKESISAQFELLGYPVNPEFHHIEDIEPVRKKWNIAPGEIPVLVSMGKNGVGVLENIFKELKTFDHSLPIRYIFVCGKNADLKNRLETNSKSYFTICGLLSPQEMNEVMNICPFYISKPGGAVTSEAMTTGTYLLMMCSQFWEEANGAKVEVMGGGMRLNTSEPIALQVENCVNKLGDLKKSPINNPPWRELLTDLLKSL